MTYDKKFDKFDITSHKNINSNVLNVLKTALLTPISVSNNIFSAVLRSREPIYLSSLQIIKNPYWIVPDPEIKVSYIVPLMYADEKLGVLAIMDSDETKLDKTEQSMILILSNQIAAALSIYKYKQKLKELASKDPLTGINNRFSFEKHMEKLLLMSKEKNVDIGLMIVDIDGFKNVNDTFGHQKGDEVLKTLATILYSNIRENDIAARIGGDEFVVAMFSINKKILDNVAERIKDTFNKEVNLLFANNSAPNLTICIGISIKKYDEQMSLDDLIRTADLALYEAKKSGKNKVIFK